METPAELGCTEPQSSALFPTLSLSCLLVPGNLGLGFLLEPLSDQDLFQMFRLGVW